MRSKYLISTALVSLFIMGAALGVIAQQQGKRVDRADSGKMAMRMADKLNLTQDQRTQIKGILDSAKSEAQRIKGIQSYAGAEALAAYGTAPTDKTADRCGPHPGAAPEGS